MRRITGSLQRRIRVKDRVVYRVRQCTECEARLRTAEVHRKDETESKADRCPQCIVGPGRVRRGTAAWSRPLAGRRVNHAADAAGALVRRRECANGCLRKEGGSPFRWSTWEVRADGHATKDVTICPCGGQMLVAAYWNPHLDREE
jgi:hypothetical protein